MIAVLPDIRVRRAVDRAFLGRAVRYLAAEAGIRQFLDIGTGLPTADNTHEVAQAVAPETRIVYVDNDPLVLAHARALLTSTPEGATDYIDADLHDPARSSPAAAQTLDFGQPIAVMLLGVLQLMPDDDEAAAIVRRLMAGVPSGQLPVDHPPDQRDHGEEIAGQAVLEPVRARRRSPAPRPTSSPASSTGLELLEPGVVPCTRWRPSRAPTGDARARSISSAASAASRDRDRRRRERPELIIRDSTAKSAPVMEPWQPAGATAGGGAGDGRAPGVSRQPGHGAWRGIASGGVPAGAADRRGRDGRGVPGQGRAPRPAGRAEGHGAGDGRRRDVPPAFHPGVAGGRCRGRPAHHPGL